MFEIYLDSTCIQALLEKDAGHLLTDNQIRHLRQTVLDTGDVEPSSPAERLLKKLQNDPKCSYVCLFAEWDTAFLTIPKQRQKPSCEFEC